MGGASAYRGAARDMAEFPRPFAHPGGYACRRAGKGLKEVAPFDISVAAYPCSPDSTARERLTTYAQDEPAPTVQSPNSSFGRRFFASRQLAYGSRRRLVPASAVSNVATTRSCRSCVRHPEWLDRLFEGLDELPAARQLVAATIAGELCGQLYAGGVRHFHFYTLNRAELAYAICHLLGVRA